MDKEQLNKLVEDTLNSIEGIEQAEANPFLYAKINERANGRKASEKFSLGYGTKLFLAFAILVVINAFTLLIYSSNYSNTTVTTTETTSAKQDINSFINEYNLVDTNYNY